MFSRKEMTQGNLLSMLMYAIAVFLLIQALASHTKWDWYADDLACAAALTRLKEWTTKDYCWGRAKNQAEAHLLFDNM